MTGNPRRTVQRVSAYCSGAVLLLLAWGLLPLAFGETIVPYPWTVVARLVGFMGGIDIWVQMGITLARTLIGFAAALLLGTVLGFISGRLLLVSRTLFLPVSIIQGAPPLLWIVPLVLIMGSGGLAPVGVVFFVVLPVVVISVREGMKTLDPAGLEMMRVYAPTRFTVLREFYLPGLAGHFKSLLLTGLLLGLKSSIIGEWFGARSGVGRLINEYFYNFDMPSFYAVALFYVLIVVLLAWSAGRLGQRLFTRRPTPVPASPAGPGDLVRSRAHSSRLEFRDVSFSYGRKRVCDGLFFSLGQGRTAVLTGESGAGKTTLARLALGLLRPKTGTAVVPKHGSLIFQEDVFLNHRDCVGNIMLAVRRDERSRAAARALDALAAVGLSDQAHHFPDELSGGMKKRLAFARALAFDPDFIILDEPFNKLHKKARLELWDLYFRLFDRKGIPSLIITHFPEELTRRRGLSFFEMKDGTVRGKRAGRK